MKLDLSQDQRRDLLEKAADKAGGKAELGRLLGYKDGAFVGQMIRGERAITEKVMAKLEAKPGYRDWFSAEGVEGEEEMPLDPETRAMADLMGDLSEAERREVYTAIQHQVALVIGKRELAKRFGVKGYATDAKVGETIKAAPRAKRKEGE